MLSHQDPEWSGPCPPLQPHLPPPSARAMLSMSQGLCTYYSLFFQVLFLTLFTGSAPLYPQVSTHWSLPRRPLLDGSCPSLLHSPGCLYLSFRELTMSVIMMIYVMNSVMPEPSLQYQLHAGRDSPVLLPVGSSLSTWHMASAP